MLPNTLGAKTPPGKEVKSPVQLFSKQQSCRKVRRSRLHFFLRRKRVNRTKTTVRVAQNSMGVSPFLVHSPSRKKFREGSCPGNARGKQRAAENRPGFRCREAAEERDGSETETALVADTKDLPTDPGGLPAGAKDSRLPRSRHRRRCLLPPRAPSTPATTRARSTRATERRQSSLGCPPKNKREESSPCAPKGGSKNPSFVLSFFPSDLCVCVCVCVCGCAFVWLFFRLLLLVWWCGVVLVTVVCFVRS
mmetsp:Transcript_16401/g.37631  ORF Transcript_16401/g.37631 Transcript_16401/m.37631 type:complete len:250 (-) Transcript_16401:78-827(-)